MVAREQQARTEMLEAFADFDDALLEQIIEDRQLPTEEVYSVATRTLQHHDLIPVLVGAAGHGNGLLRLMKSLRHEAPEVTDLRKRLGLPAGAVAIASLADQWKHLGKLTLIRALEDEISSGCQLGGDTIGGLNSLDGRTARASKLRAGEFALTIKSDHILAARVLTADKTTYLPDWAKAHPPIVKRVAHALTEKDEGKLSSALAQLAEIDPGLVVERDTITGALITGVQGEQHLKAMVERLKTTFGIDVECSEVPVPMRETIRGATTIHHRHRKQSGGAGQFADVVIDVAPAKSGSGFTFEEKIKGGVVPRNYIPSVEVGAREALEQGPAGFRVVDVSVTLLDGKSHSVDSSDYAFKTAGHNAVREALEEAGTTILRPVLMVEIEVPSTFTGTLVQIVSGLKGQVLKFEAHPTAVGWDVFSAFLPMEAECQLSRSLGGATRGTAWFHCSLDHYERAPVPTEHA